MGGGSSNCLEPKLGLARLTLVQTSEFNLIKKKLKMFLSN